MAPRHVVGEGYSVVYHSGGRQGGEVSRVGLARDTKDDEADAVGVTPRSGRSNSYFRLKIAKAVQQHEICSGDQD